MLELAATIAPDAALSSQEFRSLIDAMFGVIDGCRWPELHRFFTPDCVYDRPGYDPIEGLPALRRFYEHERVIASGVHTLHAFVAQDGRAVAMGEFTGLLRDGRPVHVEYADAYEFEDGKIRSRRTYFYTPSV
ncbi:MAG: nuclear transport factor 2 family protein [Caulobacteraceae bacterium]